MITCILSLFVGYIIGRVGHVIGGNIAWIPHHWIFGVIIMVAPLCFKKISKKVKILIILFGLGLVISDFRDFVRLETFQPEDVTIVKFWAVD